jgi:hypothetical protein
MTLLLVSIAGILIVLAIIKIASTKKVKPSTGEGPVLRPEDHPQNGPTGSLNDENITHLG